jgi:antitoxin ParD1/3/4
VLFDSRKPFRNFEPIPGIGIFEKKLASMAKNTSILLGEYFENFVNEKISSGKYSSVSEVIRTALRLMENEENKYKALIKELETGEKSGFVKNYDRTENLKNLHAKHLEK